MGRIEEAGKTPWMAAAMTAVVVILGVGCGGDSGNEIGNSGVTEEELAEAVEEFEADNPKDERPQDLLDNVTIDVMSCEVAEFDGSIRRSVWVGIENGQSENISVVADITFADGTVLTSEPADAGAMTNGEPGLNSFGTRDTAVADASREGDDCFDEVEGVAIASIGGAVWMDTVATGDEVEPTATSGEVTLTTTLCEIVEGIPAEEGLRRSIWTKAENSGLDPVSVVAEITLTDGTVLTSDAIDVEAMADGEPGDSRFGTWDTAIADESRLDQGCFADIESVAIASIN